MFAWQALHWWSYLPRPLSFHSLSPSPCVCVFRFYLYFQLCVCMCETVCARACVIKGRRRIFVHVSTVPWTWEERVGGPGIEVAGNCQQPQLGAGSQTSLQCESSLQSAHFPLSGLGIWVCVRYLPSTLEGPNSPLALQIILSDKIY